MEETEYTIFIGNTVTKGMATFDGDRGHLKNVKLAKDPYTFIDWLYDVCFGWFMGKRKEKVIDALGNVSPDVEIQYKPYYNAHTGKVTGKVRIVLTDLQLNKDLNLMEKMPGIVLGTREELQNMNKIIYLLDTQLTNIQEALKGQEPDRAMKEVLKMANGMQEIKKKIFTFNDYLGKHN